MSRGTMSTVFLTLGVAASAILGQSKNGPPIPYIDKGACPFECCTYRRWDVLKPTLVRSAMKDTAPVSFPLKPREKVLGMTGVVITTQPGIVRALKNTTLNNVLLKRGDELFLLTNLGEGFSKIWFKGRIFEGDPNDESTYKTIREGKAIWWVKIKNRKGQIGWSRQPENFGNVDQCG
ncbi:MAG: hypothetical protein ABJB34_02465 [Acidobacteriota bacterium]